MTTPKPPNVISSLRWQALAKITSQGVNWLVTIIVMRILAPSDYGLMAMAMVVIGLVTMVSELGIGSSIIQSSEINEQQQKSLYGAALILNSAFCTLLILCAPLISHFFAEPRLEAIIKILSLQLPLAALATLPGAVAARDMKFKLLSIIEILSLFISSLVTLLSALNGFEVWSLVHGHLALAIVRPTILIATVRTKLPSFRMNGLKKHLAYGGTLTTNRLVWYFYSQADIFVAGKILGNELLGIYSIAVTLATLPMQKISSIANGVAFSSFSRIQDDKNHVSEAVLQAVNFMALVAIPTLWGLLCISPELIPLAIGEKWNESIIPLQIIAFITPLRMVQSVLGTATLGVGNAKIDLLNNIYSAFFLIPAFIFGALTGGVIGLAVAWLIVFPILFLFATKRIVSTLGITTRNVFNALKYPVVGGLIMIPITLSVNYLPINLSHINLLALKIATGFTIFPATIYILSPNYFKKTYAIILNK